MNKIQDDSHHIDRYYLIYFTTLLITSYLKYCETDEPLQPLCRIESNLLREEMKEVTVRGNAYQPKLNLFILIVK